MIIAVFHVCQVIMRNYYFCQISAASVRMIIAVFHVCQVIMRNYYCRLPTGNIKIAS